MKYQKKLSLQIMGAVGIFMMMLLLPSCSSKGNKRFVFNSLEDAVATCRQQLSAFQNIREADINELTEVITTWMELQDSVNNYYSNDSTIQMNSQIISEYYIVSDSIRNEIFRVAKTQTRSLHDITYLKLSTAHDRKKTVASKDYQVARDAFANMDKTGLYPDASSTLAAYKDLLVSTATFSKEGDVMRFLENEDRCFRSLLNHLTEINQEELADITEKTARIFDNLYGRVSQDTQNGVSERVMMYLTMRFNRRILQNAEACRKDIKAKKKLDEQQTNNYRWMLIQPFMSIDNYSMASLTDTQEKELLRLSDELPSLIAYLDGSNSRPNDLKNITEILSDFFLESYLKSTL